MMSYEDSVTNLLRTAVTVAGSFKDAGKRDYVELAEAIETKAKGVKVKKVTTLKQRCELACTWLTGSATLFVTFLRHGVEVTIDDHKRSNLPV